MANFLTEFVIAFPDVVAAKVANVTGAILVKLRAYGAGDDEESFDDEPLFGTAGFYVRPMPEQLQDSGVNRKGKAEAVALRYGNALRVVATRDLRLNAEVQPDNGSLGMAHYGGGYVDLSWTSENAGTKCTIYASRKDSGTGMVTAAHSLTMDPLATGGSVVLEHQLGASVTLSQDGGIQVTSALTGGVQLGPTGPQDNVMLATQLMAWIAQVNTALTAIAGAAGGIVPPTVAPTAAPLMSSSVTAAL